MWNMTVLLGLEYCDMIKYSNSKEMRVNEKVCVGRGLDGQFRKER